MSSALLDARPPATDYITYLTIVEYNLSRESLSTFLDILQDEKLTINIGWDLVHLLLPLLPESEDCLYAIAKLGNPREVLLKVTECLRLLSPTDASGETQDNESEPDCDEVDMQPSEHQQSSSGAKNNSSTLLKDVPLIGRQCKVLIDLLSILHSRIKTKFPSRFLSTSLSAVLAGIVKVQVRQDVLIEAAIDLAASLNKQRQLSRKAQDQNQVQAPDPEAYQGESSSEDDSVQVRLLHSFATHLVDLYALTIPSDDENPGLGAASGIFENLEPRKVLPDKQRTSQLFQKYLHLKLRRTMLQKLSSLVDDLGLSTVELWTAAEEVQAPEMVEGDEEEDTPETPNVIPLSKAGSLVLLSYQIFLQSSDPISVLKTFDIFPMHAQLMRNLIGTEDTGGIASAGSESETLIDALLAFGLAAIQNNTVGEPKDDEDFTLYLQLISLVSANCPSSSLRFHAHYLTSTVLRCNPSDVARLAFIRDTLEHCPFENLKTSAVSWIKGETLEANSAVEESNENCIFATPVALETISPFLFVDPAKALDSSSTLEAWNVLRSNMSFYLATLNFYYLLLTAKHLRDKLDIRSLHLQKDIDKAYLDPLRSTSVEIKESLNSGPLRIAEGERGADASKVELMVLDDVLERVDHAIKELDWR